MLGLCTAIKFMIIIILSTAPTLAQIVPPFVASVVELEIEPAALEKFLAALKQNAAETIKPAFTS